MNILLNKKALYKFIDFIATKENWPYFPDPEAIIETINIDYRRKELNIIYACGEQKNFDFETFDDYCRKYREVKMTKLEYFEKYKKYHVCYGDVQCCEICEKNNHYFLELFEKEKDVYYDYGDDGGEWDTDIITNYICYDCFNNEKKMRDWFSKYNNVIKNYISYDWSKYRPRTKRLLLKDYLKMESVDRTILNLAEQKWINLLLDSPTIKNDDKEKLKQIWNSYENEIKE